MSNTPKLLLPNGFRPRRTRVRNQMTGRVLPCCWSDCERDGYDEIQVAKDHEDPRWPGEKRIYIFCSDAHRAMMFP